MIKKYFDPYSANTLKPEYIGENDSGWEIIGEIKVDGYEWVNEFEAYHSKYGKVWGDFQNIVYADSEEGYENFIENHPPYEWDYGDI